MGTVVYGMYGNGDGWCGDGDDTETSSVDSGEDADESCGDSREWVQISVPMQLSSRHTNMYSYNNARTSSRTANKNPGKAHGSVERAALT